MKYFIGLILAGCLNLSVPAHAKGLTDSEMGIVRAQYYVYGRDCDVRCQEDILRRHRWAERERREREEYWHERERRRHWRWERRHSEDD